MLDACRLSVAVLNFVSVAAEKVDIWAKTCTDSLCVWVATGALTATEPLNTARRNAAGEVEIDKRALAVARRRDAMGVLVTVRRRARLANLARDASDALATVGALDVERRKVAIGVDVAAGLIRRTAWAKSDAIDVLDAAAAFDVTRRRVAGGVLDAAAARVMARNKVAIAVDVATRARVVLRFRLAIGVLVRGSGLDVDRFRLAREVDVLGSGLEVDRFRLAREVDVRVKAVDMTRLRVAGGVLVAAAVMGVVTLVSVRPARATAVIRSLSFHPLKSVSVPAKTKSPNTEAIKTKVSAAPGVDVPVVEPTVPLLATRRSPLAPRVRASATMLPAA